MTDREAVYVELVNATGLPCDVSGGDHAWSNMTTEPDWYNPQRYLVASIRCDDCGVTRSRLLDRGAS